MNNTLGVFVGQSKTKLVLGRQKFRVYNTYAPSTEHPRFVAWEHQHRPKELTELGQLYHDFCKKAYDLILTSYCPDIPHQIILPNFHYEIIPDKFPIE